MTGGDATYATLLWHSAMALCYGTLLCLPQSITIAQISRRYRLFIKAVNTLRSIELEREI
jgi:hypothetical protein